MTTKLIYNERVRLTASLVNLVAVGLTTAGVTSPLVGAFYGVQIWPVDTSPFMVTGVAFLWLAGAAMAHLVALLILGDLME